MPRTAGFAHVSCLAEQAKILVEQAMENNLDHKVKNERWARWDRCSLCEQRYHGVVKCALGWACWKTYVGRPETDQTHGMAMSLLGSGLCDARHDEDALSVQEARLSLMRRIGASESSILVAQSNLAITYQKLGRDEEALSLRRDVYSGTLKLCGEEHRDTLLEAHNYASSLIHLQRFEEAKSLLRKTMPVARRVLGESHDLTLTLKKVYADSLYEDDSATLNDLREAVTTLEDAARTARRVLGSSHPTTECIEDALRLSREARRAREGDNVSALRELVAAMPPPGSA